MRLRLTFLISLAAVLAFATAWLQAHVRSRELHAAIAAMAPDVPARDTRPIEVPSAALEDSTALDSELTDRALLLDEARRIPEVARREATLRVIFGLKASHTSSPPPPNVLPPPLPKDGGYFVELLDDPAYVALQLEQWRTSSGNYSEERMQRLGIPADLRRQVVDIEFDNYATSIESARFARDQTVERTAALAATEEARRENDARLRSLLGEEMFARYSSMEGHVTVSAEVEFIQLATRLSYSSTPLTPTDLARLDAELQAIGQPKSPGDFRKRAAALDARVRAVLRPEQVAALDELRAEQEASTLRSKLPKSSELPRTSRRARLEGAN